MTIRALLTAAATMCMATTPLFAQYDKQPPAKPATPTAPKTPDKATPPGMPSQDQMMEAWAKIANPGPNHQLLSGMVGEWTCECKFWMDPTPGAAPTSSKGTAVNTWAMDKRFVKQEFTGTMTMGPGAPEMPFHGMGYTGFDNQKQKFVSSWMDNMSTGIMYSEGSYDAGAKTFTFSAACTDPMTNEPCTMKEVIKIVDDSTHNFLMYNITKDGKETKMGEITYHRKGGMKPVDGMDKPKLDKPMDTRPATPTTPTKPGRGSNPG